VLLRTSATIARSGCQGFTWAELSALSLSFRDRVRAVVIAYETRLIKPGVP
jgi:hypothetical protein